MNNKNIKNRIEVVKNFISFFENEMKSNRNYNDELYSSFVELEDTVYRYTARQVARDKKQKAD